MSPVPRLGRELAVGPATVLAYVDRYVPMVNAGAEWMLHAMLQDTARRGHRVIVATPCTDRHRMVDGVEVYPVREGLRAGADAEVVVGHLLFTREVIDLARRSGRPLLYLVHNHDQLRAWQVTRDDVTAVVWNSEWIGHEGRYMREVRGVPGTTVRPPLDMARYLTDDGAREYVTLVNPIQAKGSDVFYDLARRFPRARFLAVEGAYGTQRRPQPQERNVEWQPATGEIARDVYARTRVLLMPSHYESWGRVACEALCSGIPVIAAPTPGLTEALASGATFVDHDDLDGWARALASLDDPEVYAEASARATARALYLDELALLDLERWDRLIRLAAGGARLRSGLMETTPADTYDPFRGSKAKARPEGDDPPAADGGQPVEPAEVDATTAELLTWLDEAERQIVGVEIQRAWGTEPADDDAWEGLVGMAVTEGEEGLPLGDVLDYLTGDHATLTGFEADEHAALTAPGDPAERTFRAYLEAANGDVLAISSPTLPIIDPESVEPERVRVYEAALEFGLSDAEARAEGWPEGAGIVAPVGAQEPGAVIPPDGGPEAPTAQEGAQEPTEWEVPAKAVDIVHALGTEQDPAERERKARAVWEAERQRSKPRPSVLAAADKILA